MKVLSAEKYSTLDHSNYHDYQSILVVLKNWIEEQEPVWDYYRFGIAATGIFIQVSFAAMMVGILGMAGASPFVFGIGIALAFMANSIAFANSRMRIVLGLFVVSIVVNVSLTLIYGLPMLLN